MRHRNSGRKLGRTAAHRHAMLRNLACSLIEHGRVVTTLAKAKEARVLVERCITTAKKGSVAFASVESQLPALKEQSAKLREQLAAAGSDENKAKDLRRQIDRVGGRIAALQAQGIHHRRLCLQRLHSKDAVQKLFSEVAPKYTERAGGYTRILKAGYRLGDKATKAIFELV